MSGSRPAILTGVLRAGVRRAGVRRIVILTIVLVIAGGVLLAWPAAALAGHVTELVSLSSAETQATAECNYPSVSTDGRYVAFESDAADLVAGDTGGYTDIFVRDRVTGNTERVSVSSAEAQANGDSAGAVISADGRYVAFYSYATNLVSGDTNSVSDIFVRDRVLGTTVRVSRSTGGTQGNGVSSRPSISADGRYIAFESKATNLVSGDTNALADIFVHDLIGGTTSRVSIGDDEAQAGLASRKPAISADGRYVAFTSEAANLVSGDTNGKTDVFVRDRVAGTTERVSVATGGTQADGRSDGASISATGRFVAFESDAPDLVAGDTFGYMDVFVRDRAAGTTERVSVSTSEAQANNYSYWCAISANGRYITFQSVATNLAWEDTNGNWDVFLRDRETGATTMLSVATDWTQGNGPSASPAISADGRCVAFASTANNLTPGDANAVADVFLISNHILVSPVPPIAYSGIRGSDRYQTAIKISQIVTPVPGALPAGSGVVLAPGTSFPEALCGAPLAAAYGGPVLLTPTTGLNADVRAELQRLDPDYVFVIGLSNTIRNSVQTALPAATVTAIGGSTIYHMSRNVANALETRVGDMSGAVGLVTIGTKFPDALGLGPLACAYRWPIILTDQTSGALHAQAAATFTDLGITQMIKVGTYAGPPPGVTSLANLSGADRYYTNANVADWEIGHEGFDPAHTAFATGDKFPDALAAGPYLGRDLGVLLLSPVNGPVPDAVATLLYDNRADVDALTFIACIEPVISLVKGLLP
jgi:Tol biopolymer transport system component